MQESGHSITNLGQNEGVSRDGNTESQHYNFSPFILKVIDSSQHGSIVLTNKSGFSVHLTALQAEGLARCSELVKSEVEFNDGKDSDSEQPMEIRLNTDINPQIVQEILGYLKRHDYNPVPPKKVISRQLEDHFTNPEDLKLAQDYYDPTKCLMLRDVASYLQIPSIISICNLLTAITHPTGATPRSTLV